MESENERRRRFHMKHIQTLNGATLKNSACKGGCGECQTSCQSACKTSCTVANQKCENKDNK
jgi:predicted ribosomally synthesized six-cysteine peptide SCIFF